MKKIKDWLIKKAGSITIALTNVEKSALNQTGEMMSSDINHAQRHTQGQVADSLINGEITQEVMDLRWRTYKVLQESDELKTEIIGYETDGTPITKTHKRDVRRGLTKIQMDKFDSYPLEMVIPNDEIITSGSDVMDSKYLDLSDKPSLNYNDKGEVESATHGEIKGEAYYFTNKSEKPIKINGEYTRRFYIENFAKKMNIRSISNDEKLLEFYISAYPDEYNRNSRLLISELKKIMNDGKKSDILEFNEVEFVTYKCIGVHDFKHYKFKDLAFDKIIEFNGNYVIKFKAMVSINGEDIMLKYKQDELETKYQNKSKK